MKKTLLFIAAIILIIGKVNAQDVSNYNEDTLKFKMQVYKEMLLKANVYQAKAEEELKNVKFYQKQARNYLDSSFVIAKKAETDKKNAQLYLLQFNYVYDLADKFIAKSDSLMSVVDAYKDTAVMKNREAETFYLGLVDKYNAQMTSDSLHPQIFTVQLGAGNMSIDYFSKVTELEVITPGDGIKRFITGSFTTKEAALECKNKMLDLGYTDAFIRSMESLNY